LLCGYVLNSYGLLQYRIFNMRFPNISIHILRIKIEKVKNLKADEQVIQIGYIALMPRKYNI